MKERTAQPHAGLRQLLAERRISERSIVAGGPADPVAFTRAKHDWIAAALAHLGLADEPPRRLYQDDLNQDNPDRRLAS